MKNSKNIFLIEDDKDDQDFFTEALSEIENANLFAIANNGKEAIEKLKNSAILPDLIFMDINMPLMNGIECLISVSKNSLTKNIPVVMLTTDTEKMELVQKLGAKAFIKKPSNGKILREKIEQMINLDFIVESRIASQTFHRTLASY